MTEPTLVAWILYDATADKKYIKMDPTNGSLAIFDSEEAAMEAKKLHYGTEYKRCEYYSKPQPEPVKFCEDTALSLAERTFSSEVDEQLAEDVIQYARRLHNRYTVSQQPSTKCPGAGCTDQGCPAHYANDYQTTSEVAKLVEALEGLLAIVSDSSGVAGYHLNGDIAQWSEFEEVEMAEEALSLHHQQGGDL